MIKQQIKLINGDEFEFYVDDEINELKASDEKGFTFERINGTAYFFPMSAILYTAIYDAIESEE